MKSLKEKEIIVYHGSHEIIKTPTFGLGNPHNDYGLGFYCTPHLSLAKEWSCDAREGGYANKYLLHIEGLNILNLNDEKYSVLHWLSVLLSNRKISFDNKMEMDAYEFIIKNYPVDLSHYDIIIGYRADDSYFSYARDFLSNTISLETLSNALRLGNLGNQIVIKSPLAFSRLEFLGYEEADRESFYFQKEIRDGVSRIAYFANRDSGFSSDETFIIDIMRGNKK